MFYFSAHMCLASTVSLESKKSNEDENIHFKMV